tara:strand:- start:238 stop:429 length:192 start_codon:yes stop_codon:yes gene_type:complete
VFFNEFLSFLKLEEDMKKKNNIEKKLQELVKKDLFNNLSIKETAAFEMLRQQKIRKILNRDIH